MSEYKYTRVDLGKTGLCDRLEKHGLSTSNNPILLCPGRRILLWLLRRIEADEPSAYVEYIKGDFLRDGDHWVLCQIKDVSVIRR